MASTEKLCKYLKDEFDRMDIDYQERMKSYDDWHAIFRGRLDPKLESTSKSHLVLNRVKVAVRHGIANVIDILFANADFFDVVGRTKEDHRGAAVTKKITTWLVGIGDFIDEATKYILQAAIYGTTFGKIVKRNVVEVSMDRTPVINFIRKVLGYKKHLLTKTVSFPALEMVDIYDMWIDPLGLGIEREKSSGLFHRFRRTQKYLEGKQREDVYHDVSDLDESAPATHTEDGRRKNVGLSDPKPTEGERELYEYHGVIPSDIAKEAGIEVAEGEMETECIVTWSKKKNVTIREERNIFPGQQRMFIADVWEASGDKDLHGSGIPENARGPQMALNATINQRLDNKSWAIAAPLIVNMDALEDEDDLVARSNWVIRGHGKPSDLAQFIQMPDITRDAVNEGREFERQIADEAGINKTVEASQSFGSNRTAQGISIAFSAASRPVRAIARGFERNLISKGLKKIYTMFLSDLDEEILIRVTDDPRAPEFVKVDPLSLTLDIDFVPKGTFALASREAVAQNLVQFAQAAASMPPQVQMQINWAYLVKKFYESLFGSTDWDQIWLGGDGNAGQPGIPGVGAEGLEGSVEGAGGAPGILGAIAAASQGMVRGGEGTVS